jgi:twitching motility protein PilT
MTEGMSPLAASAFKDLYIGSDFADVMDLEGASSPLCPAPQAWALEIEAIRNLCKTREQELGIPEFSILYSEIVFRVTHLDSAGPGGVYVLRRSEAQIRDVRSLGLPRMFVDTVLAKGARGLVLICGEMGVGKTTTAASFVVERLKQHGGIALAIEDPTETNIHGAHGQGRCIAISASRYNGGYAEHLLRGLRSGASFFFIGEIRDEATAFRAIEASMNGSLIIATFHSGDIPGGIERLITLAGAHTSKAPEMIADSLLAVVWQSLETLPKQSGGMYRRLMASTLVVAKDDVMIRQAIRTNAIPTLEHEIDRQANEQTWSGSKAGFSS